ncbi:hypothetical protein A3Q32_19580 [Alcanivorax sp. KX64203]|nr:hypothetical protein A3Q32_19580 [Alcanivorax sp. KX64203]
MVRFRCPGQDQATAITSGKQRRPSEIQDKTISGMGQSGGRHGSGALPVRGVIDAVIGRHALYLQWINAFQTGDIETIL